MRAVVPGHIVCRELKEHWACDSAALCVGLCTESANTGAQHQPQRESSKPIKLMKSQWQPAGSDTRQAQPQMLTSKSCQGRDPQAVNLTL